MKNASIRISAGLGAVCLGALVLGACATTAPATLQTAGLAAGDRTRALASLDRYVEAEMKRLKAPGLSISLVSGDAVLLEKGYGWADREAGRKVDADTVFPVASVSKLFTSAAIMKLVEAGKVDLDAPVTTYIPELALKTRDSSFGEVTVRSMLTHHSGMPSDVARNFMYATVPANHATAFRELPAELAGTWAATKPGTVFSYSNLSFSLLGLVVERASGMNFEDYEQKAVLGPLGMSSTSFNFRPELGARYVRGYENGRKGVRIPVIRDIPAGQLMSTPRDMSRFLKAALASARGADGLFRPETMQEVLTCQNGGVPLDFGFRIGLTWWLMEIPELPGVLVAGHGGDLAPFHSLLLIVPEKDVAVEINVNNGSGLGSLDLKGIAVQALRTAIGLKEGSDPLVVPAAAPVAPVPADLDGSIDGWYSSQMGLFRLHHAGKAVKLDMMGQTVDATYHADGSFSLSYRLLGIVPLDIPLLRDIRFTMPEYAGKPWMALIVNGIPFGAAERITPEPVPPEWMARTGKYAVLDPDGAKNFDDVAIRFDRASGFLMLDYRMLGSRGSLVIRPAGTDQFVTWGTGRNMNETGSFAPDGTGETLRFVGFRMKKR